MHILPQLRQVHDLEGGPVINAAFGAEYKAETMKFILEGLG